MVTKYETEHENIIFSYTVKDANLNTRFDWGGKKAVTPWHTTYFKVNIKVYDENTNWMARDHFYIPLADWETKKVIREAVLQIIYQHVTFPERIDGQGASKVFHDSVKKLYDDIREHYLEENFEGIVG